MKKIEETRKWPGDQCKTRAAFLCKDDTDQGNPMAHRILKITSTLYRVWAPVRMKNLEKSIETWAEDAMFAGVPGAGAEEGWYLTQLDFETKSLGGMQISAGSIDIYKYFDQILRPLITAVAEKAGMPQQILETYRNFIDDIGIRMQIGTSLGEEHKHPCSIPQGCPFSMTLIALRMRPLIKLVRGDMS